MNISICDRGVGGKKNNWTGGGEGSGSVVAD